MTEKQVKQNLLRLNVFYRRFDYETFVENATYPVSIIMSIYT